ncbi:ly6/PLAUR domain-containing protein 6B isoform X2 [Dendropsophus ebraccatus]|uniref:ly6/PLAUR domain-containing protein 6B isoform X2 n=1 Tax=Dendropsophus ebraccatus TaxID=150705 RepID=UPI00383120EA
MVTAHLLILCTIIFFIVSKDGASAKNVNFHNVRPPLDHTHYCKTVHHFTGHGKSKSVTKKCATREECHHLGCHHHRDSGHTECVSCCDGMICNVDLPTNHTNAVLRLMRSHQRSGAYRATVFLPAVVTAILILVIL